MKRTEADRDPEAQTSNEQSPIHDCQCLAQRAWSAPNLIPSARKNWSKSAATRKNGHDAKPQRVLGKW